MGFSSARYDQKPDKRPWKVHPIWRGIGCILLIVVPILSFIFARFFMTSVNWFPMPIELLRPVIFSYYGSVPIDSIIYRINDFLNGRLLYGDLFFTVIFAALAFGVLSIGYGTLYRLIGPPRYGPLDSPPVKQRRSRR
jgi:hypothetical protein